MKRFVLLLTALALLLTGTSCTSGQSQPQGDYVLYFAVDPQLRHGPALDSQPYEGEDPDPRDLLSALLAGPTQEGLTSPFPRGVTVSGWTLADGVLTITLSEQYSGLADVALTLADYSIVLTLTQLDGVEEVEIVSAGHSANYRSHQRLLPEEAELTPPDQSGT